MIHVLISMFSLSKMQEKRENRKTVFKLKHRIVSIRKYQNETHLCGVFFVFYFQNQVVLDQHLLDWTQLLCEVCYTAVCLLAVQGLGRKGWTVPFRSSGSLHKMEVFVKV